ncbi:MAG: hypothetical protein E7158_06175 [Firmicutes bacterium]|nr:hypothetical protein [Bacillota bacterium]
MKKAFLIVIMCFLVCGCVNINKSNIDEILTDSLKSELKFHNINRNGYKYYVPKGLKVITKNDYNEILADGNYKYYLYVDVLSYYNKINFDYIKKTDVYYSNVLKYKDNFGYLEIKKFESDKYLIEIMYNYAKIEVMVEYDDINSVIANSISVLSSIDYSDKVLANLLGDNKLNFNDEEFNIFETADTESNYLNYVEKYDNYESNDSHDNDFID